MGQSESLATKQICECKSTEYLPYKVYLAAINGHNTTVSKYLMDGDANAMYSGWTLLHTACNHGRDKLVAEIIRDPRVCVNMRSKCEKTAFMMAAERGHKDCIEVLLSGKYKCQLEVESLNSYGDTALDVACKNNHHDVAFLLMATTKNKECSVPSKEKSNLKN